MDGLSHIAEPSNWSKSLLIRSWKNYEIELNNSISKSCWIIMENSDKTFPIHNELSSGVPACFDQLDGSAMWLSPSIAYSLAQQQTLTQALCSAAQSNIQSSKSFLSLTCPEKLSAPSSQWVASLNNFFKKNRIWKKNVNLENNVKRRWRCLFTIIWSFVGSAIKYLMISRI